MLLRLKPKIWRMVTIGIMTVVAAYFLYRLRNVLWLFIVAIVLAYILDPIVNFLQGFRIPRLWAIIIIYLIGFFLLYILALYFFPLLLKQLNVFVETIPHYTEQIQQKIADFNKDYQRFNVPEVVRKAVDRSVKTFEARLVNWTETLVKSTVAAVPQVLSLILAPILSFYFLQDMENIKSKLASWIPESWKKEIMPLWKEIDLILTSFIRGHLIVACFVGIATAIGLALLNVDFPILLGIIAGLADLIPYFGPILGALPAVALALLQSVQLAVYVALLMFFIQQLESNVLTPKILGNSVGLHPLFIIFALLAGGELYGILGMLFAVPVAAVLKVIFVYLFQRIYHFSGEK